MSHTLIVVGLLLASALCAWLALSDTLSPRVKDGEDDQPLVVPEEWDTTNDVTMPEEEKSDA